jgi:hypothetical protein
VLIFSVTVSPLFLIHQSVGSVGGGAAAAAGSGAPCVGGLGGARGRQAQPGGQQSGGSHPADTSERVVIALHFSPRDHAGALCPGDGIE